MKNCTKCKKVREDKDFYADKRTKNGLYSACKYCHASARTTSKDRVTLVRYFPTISAVTDYYFGSLLSRIKTSPLYSNIRCLMSKDDFKKFVEKNWDNYMAIHDLWRKSDYTRKFSPCLDRINPKGHYELNNIRFITISENTRRGLLGKKFTMSPEHKEKIRDAHHRRNGTFKERAYEMIVQSEAGMKQEDIARHHGVSQARVHQLIKKYKDNPRIKQ